MYRPLIFITYAYYIHIYIFGLTSLNDVKRIIWIIQINQADRSKTHTYIYSWTHIIAQLFHCFKRIFALAYSLWLRDYVNITSEKGSTLWRFRLPFLQCYKYSLHHVLVKLVIIIHEPVEQLIHSVYEL